MMQNRIWIEFYLILLLIIAGECYQALIRDITISQITPVNKNQKIQEFNPNQPEILDLYLDKYNEFTLQIDYLTTHYQADFEDYFDLRKLNVKSAMFSIVRRRSSNIYHYKLENGYYENLDLKDIPTIPGNQLRNNKNPIFLIKSHSEPKSTPKYPKYSLNPLNRFEAMAHLFDQVKYCLNESIDPNCIRNLPELNDPNITYYKKSAIFEFKIRPSVYEINKDNSANSFKYIFLSLGFVHTDSAKSFTLSLPNDKSVVFRIIENYNNPVPIHKSLIKSDHKSPEDDRKTCSLCLDHLYMNSTEAKPLHNSKYPLTALQKCGHVFHTNCLQSWLRVLPGSSLNCPLCRQKIIRSSSPFASHINWKILDSAKNVTWKDLLNGNF